MRAPPKGKEGWKHKNIFETYLLMGPSRTVAALAQVTGVSTFSLHTWIRQWNWEDRLALRDEKAMIAVQKENDEVLKNLIMKRHQAAYQKLVEKALEYLDSQCDFAKSKSAAKDAAIALDIGIKGERSVLGLRDTKIRGALVKEGMAALLEMVNGE